MATIGIIGSGNLGANTAFFLAERNVADVVLYDIEEGRPEGKALDIIEASPIRAYLSKVSGTNSMENIFNAEVIIIAAGSVRKPGMQREELFSENRPAIGKVAAALRAYKGVVIIATEPVDSLTTLFARDCGLSAAKVMGIGGCLDSARLRYLIGRELSMSFESISAVVIGRHSKDMIPLPAYCRVSGIPVKTLIAAEKLETLFDELKISGDAIVEMAQRSSAYYGPSAVISDLAEAVVRDTRRIMSVSQMLSGQYGIEGVAMSLPAVIGRNGIEKTLTPVLDDAQKRILTGSAQAIRSAIE